METEYIIAFGKGWGLFFYKCGSTVWILADEKKYFFKQLRAVHHFSIKILLHTSNTHTHTYTHTDTHRHILPSFYSLSIPHANTKKN